MLKYLALVIVERVGLHRNTLTPNIDLGQDPGVSRDSIILLVREPEVQHRFELVFEELVP